MKAPLKKLVLARYVQVLEAIGFVLIGLLIAAMIVSAVYRMDDGVKFRLDSVDPRADPVELPAPAWVRDVEVRAGQRVEKGTTCATVVTNEAAIALVKAADALRGVEAAVEHGGTGLVPPGISARASALAAALQEAAEDAATIPVRAPANGVVRVAPDRPFDALAGSVLEGVLMKVENYETVRLNIPLAGENAPRVRINLLAEEDVRDWKELTRLLRGADPAPSKSVARLRLLLADKLANIRPGRVPLKRDQPEVVRELNAILEAEDLYDPSTWPVGLPEQAYGLIERGTTQLGRDERILLNRMLLNDALGVTIAPSADERQPVKITFYVPPSPEEAQRGARPEPYPMRGQVVAEPQDDEVLAEFPAPPAGLVEALRARADNPSLDPVYAVGSVVVGQVTLFRFLFR